MVELHEKAKFYELRFYKAIKNFQRRNFEANYFNTSKEALGFLFSNIDKDQKIGYGGSKTLTSLGIIDTLRDEGYNLLDRSNPLNTKEDKSRIERECFSADVFLASSNAVSELGHLVNIDLYNNRTSAMMFGPKKVYLPIGRNKLCTTLDEAIDRAKNYASPMNSLRFKLDKNPCTKDGICHDCRVDTRICGATSIIEWCGIKDRISLLFINEDLGF